MLHKRTQGVRVLIITLAFCLTLPLSSAFAKKSPDPAAMTLDIVLARPGGFIATLLGTAVFVVSSPFAALGGNAGESWDALVVTPASYTFQRPLGHFEYEPDIPQNLSE